ncbi:hypothetical protein [Pyrolobus fumarii]|nr:hypothetical protein [Pyrolobus fumarii]
MRRILLRNCAGVVEAFEPWVYRRGPLDVLIEEGRLTIGDNSHADVVIDCKGELVALPCFFDAFHAPRVRNGDWLDEILADPASDYNPTHVASELARRGYCGAILYSLEGGGEYNGVKLVTPSRIVTPDARVIGDDRDGMVVAAVALTRRSVYTWRSRFGAFPVEWLERNNLLKGVVVGSWIASWEVEAVKRNESIIAVLPFAQAFFRGGLPPRPAYMDVMALGTGGLTADAWSNLIAFGAMMEAAYWSSIPLEKLFSVALRASKLIIGREVKLVNGSEAFLQLVELNEQLEDIRPMSLLTARPRVIATIAGGSIAYVDTRWL